MLNRRNITFIHTYIQVLTHLFTLVSDTGRILEFPVAEEGEKNKNKIYIYVHTVIFAFTVRFLVWSGSSNRETRQVCQQLPSAVWPGDCSKGFPPLATKRLSAIKNESACHGWSTICAAISANICSGPRWNRFQSWSLIMCLGAEGQAKLGALHFDPGEGYSVNDLLLEPAGQCRQRKCRGSVARRLLCGTGLSAKRSCGACWRGAIPASLKLLAEGLSLRRPMEEECSRLLELPKVWNLGEECHLRQTG